MKANHEAPEQDEVAQQGERPRAEEGDGSREVQPEPLLPLNRPEFDQMMAEMLARLKEVFTGPLSPSYFQRRRRAIQKVLERPLDLSAAIAMFAETTDEERAVFPSGSLLESLYIADDDADWDMPLRPRTMEDCPLFEDIMDDYDEYDTDEDGFDEDSFYEDSFDEESFDEVWFGEGSNHLSAARLDALPRVPVNDSMLDDNGQANCTICGEDVPLNVKVVLLPCGHWFDKDCIKAWLGAPHEGLPPSTTCPYCRRSVLEGLRSDGSGEGAGSNGAVSSGDATAVITGDEEHEGLAPGSTSPYCEDGVGNEPVSNGNVAVVTAGAEVTAMAD